MLFSSDTHQSLKTSDSDLKVNQHIYPDAVNVLGHLGLVRRIRTLTENWEIGGIASKISSVVQSELPRFSKQIKNFKHVFQEKLGT